MSPRALLACALSIAPLLGCGEGSANDCDEAARQVTVCLDEYCAHDTGAFCGCYAEGEHLETTGGCACEEGTVWAQMEESVCEELEGAPSLDCNGLLATIRRFEAHGGCP